MSDYTQVHDYSAKDSLASGDPNKIVKGADVDDDLGAIATAIATKSNDSSVVHLAGVETITGAKTFSADTVHSGKVTMTGKSVIDANASVAAAAATSDIWSAGNYVTLTGGVVTFTDFADAPQAGAEVELFCNAAHVFTNNANLVVDGAANFTAAVGDRVLVRAKSTTVFTVHPRRLSGVPLGAPTGAQGASVVTLGTFTLTGAQASFVIGSSAGDLIVDWSAYDKVEFDLTNFVPVTDGHRFAVQYYSDGGTTPLAATYSYYANGGNTNTAAADIITGRGVGFIAIAEAAVVGIDNTATGGGLTGTLTLFSPASTSINKKLRFVAATAHATNTVDIMEHDGWGWFYGSQVAINGLRIFDPDTGNIAAGAKVTVRGYKT